MSVVVRYAPTSLSAEQYDQTHSRINETLGWPPEGLDIHVCFGAEGSLLVSEIWDSREQFDAFSERLMPVLKEVGIELSGKPEMLEIHNIVKR